ncbi:MAG TPA: hypothetical protein PLD19_09135, partial [Luteimonas sp.]|nr:hypothetical protein [Luteimonas sp.]
MNLKLINGEILRETSRPSRLRRHQKVEEGESFYAVEDRILAVRMMRYFLAGQYEIYKSLATFRSLTEGLSMLDKEFLRIETDLRRFALAELDPRNLSIYLKDILDVESGGGLHELVDELLPSRAPSIYRQEVDDTYEDDACELTETIRSEVHKAIQPLHDTLEGGWIGTPRIGFPEWLLEFERVEAVKLDQ